MTKSEVLADITRLVNGSSSLQEAAELTNKYLYAVTELERLAKWVKVNDHKPDARMTASGGGDDSGSGDDFEFGGGSFGGGGGSGNW